VNARSSVWVTAPSGAKNSRESRADRAGLTVDGECVARAGVCLPRLAATLVRSLDLRMPSWNPRAVNRKRANVRRDFVAPNERDPSRSWRSTTSSIDRSERRRFRSLPRVRIARVQENGSYGDRRGAAFPNLRNPNVTTNSRHSLVDAAC